MTVFDSPKDKIKASPSLGSLSDRELEIADLAARQLSNKEIANAAFVSVNTVKTPPSAHLQSPRNMLSRRTHKLRKRPTLMADIGLLDASGHPFVPKPGEPPRAAKLPTCCKCVFADIELFGSSTRTLNSPHQIAHLV